MARDNAELAELTNEYVSAGVYSEWPYAGALIVEKAFREKGIDAVRGLINLLRTDPPKAAAWMAQAKEGVGWTRSLLNRLFVH